jgi:hypothetical protein
MSTSMWLIELLSFSSSSFILFSSSFFFFSFWVSFCLISLGSVRYCSILILRFICCLRIPCLSFFWLNRSILNCFSYTYRHGGFPAFYKGFTPNILGIIPFQVCVMTRVFFLIFT